MRPKLKYKVGDKVHIKTLDQLKKEFKFEPHSGFIRNGKLNRVMNDSMIRDWAGHEMTISRLWEETKEPGYFVNKSANSWSEWMFQKGTENVTDQVINTLKGLTA